MAFGENQFMTRVTLMTLYLTLRGQKHTMCILLGVSKNTRHNLTHVTY